MGGGGERVGRNVVNALLPGVRTLAGGVLLLFLGGPGTAGAQQLEPRAYAPAPVGLNFIGLGATYSSGGVVTDPSLPVENVHAHVYSLPPYFGRTFGLFGRLASATLVTPYGWAHVTGDVQDVSSSIDRSGFFDPALRFGVNFFGCPALTPPAFAKRKPGTTIGASITVSAPFGQYNPSKLINLGTNRWAGKPELGLSQPLGDWVVEVYAGVWLFETNHEFYGAQVRTQDPLASFQTHVIYNFSRTVWAAADFTYYNGGSTTVGGLPKNDRQNNTRGGLAFSVPCGNTQSVKLTWAQGVSTRVGSSFQTVALVWQYRWF
jgi:outer membrane putative beta-barrel porin/alpha-amylase